MRFLQIRHFFFHTPLRATLTLVFGITQLRLPFAAMLGLGTDEAQYALYGWLLDWSYFDHPPMVGWLMALAQALFGNSDFALRIIPLAMSAASLLLVYAWSRLLFPTETPWLGFLAVALIGSSPLPFLVGMGMIPEIPLVFFGMLALLSFHRLLARPERLRHWLALGLCLGCSGLSKYTAIIIPLGMVASLCWQKKWHVMLNPRGLITIILGLICITPIMYWNIAHDWISFKYQFSHVSDNQKAVSLWSLSTAGKTLLAQGMGYLPVVLGLMALPRRYPKLATFNVKLSLMVFALWLLFMGYFGGFNFGLPHWSMLAWMVVAPLAARAFLPLPLREQDECCDEALRPHRPTLIGLAFAWLITIALFAHVLTPMPWVSKNHDYLAEVRGWDDVATDVARWFAQEYPSDAQKAQHHIYVQNWTLGGRLAWYLPPALRHKVLVLDQRPSQMSLWFGQPPPPEAQNATPKNAGLIVEWSYRNKGDMNAFAAQWGMECRFLKQHDVKHHDKTIAWFKIWQCQPR